MFITGNSGFPKASDISKTIDKRADAEREVVGKKPGYSPNRDYSENQHEGYQRPVNEERPTGKHYDKTAPATDAAREWDGWKTGLKPATEFVVMARKPFDGATVDSVLEHGTGALNIDGCRVEGGERPERDGHRKTGAKNWGDGTISGGSKATGTTTEGRYPANVVFDETEAERLDQEVGELERGDINGGSGRSEGSDGKFSQGTPTHADHTGDSGGPSRYFYTSKASRNERTENGSIENDHPTVKPLDLMEWLIKLVTAEEQTVLDPFCGSGTTLKAAKGLNRKFIGIERQAKWADVARVRVGLTPNDPSVVRSDANQSGMEAWMD